MLYVSGRLKKSFPLTCGKALKAEDLAYFIHVYHESIH